MKLLILVIAGLVGMLQAPPVESLQDKSPIRHSSILRGSTPAELAEIVPPDSFTGEAVVVTIYVNGPALENLCGKGLIACAGFQNDVPLNVLPNPCGFPNEFYAAIACHEKGHALGWKHPKKD